MRNKLTLALTILAVAFALGLAAGCTAPEKPARVDPGPPPDPEIEKRLRQWQQRNIRDYELTMSGARGGIYNYANPTIVTVRDGKAVSIVSGEKGGRGMTDLFKEYETVETMLETIRTARQKGWTVKANYHPELGYPMKIWIDSGHIDGWTGVDVKALKPLGEASAPEANKTARN
jgi:hypothetical protein